MARRIIYMTKTMTKTMTKIMALTVLLISGTSQATSWPDFSKKMPGQQEGRNDAALIVAIEDYAYIPDIAGARANADDWYTYFTRVRGMRASRVQLLFDRDGTLEEMREKLARMVGQVKPLGTFWFVFIGHGAPSKDGKDGILVGVDAQQKANSIFARSLRQGELLDLISRGKQKQAVLVLDACFSGRSHSGHAIVKGLQPMLVVSKVATTQSNTIVMTAGKSDQFAGPLPGASRPAFSYLLLGGLRGWADKEAGVGNGDGKVTASEAVGYAREALQALVTDRTQEPQLSGTPQAYVLSTRASEKGPDLVDLKRKLSKEPAPAAAREPMFGRGLGKVVNIPEVKRIHTAMPQVSLSEVDIAYLELIQAAKRAEKSKKEPARERVAAWDAVANYKGDNPLADQARKRAAEWREVEKAQRKQAHQLVKVHHQWAKDKKKLDRLTSMDEDVVSVEQKKMYKKEFKRAYAAWAKDMKEIRGGHHGLMLYIERYRKGMAACKRARQANTEAAWKEYLNVYPHGPCLEEARKRLAEIKAQHERELAEKRRREQAEKERLARLIWYDSKSGLTWQRKASNKKFTWAGAKRYCSELVLGDHSDWRLPDKQELETLIRKGSGKAENCYWPSGLKGECSWFWSSSDAYYAGSAWGVGFDDGDVYSLAKTSTRHVRCARVGP